MLGGLGRFCVRHRWLVLLLWGVGALLALALGSRVFDKLTPEWSASHLESVQGWERLDEVSDTGPRLTAVVDGVDVAEPAVMAAVAAAAQDLRATDGVARVVDPYATPSPQLRTEDGRTLLLAVDLLKDLPRGDREAAVDAVRDRLLQLETDPPPGLERADVAVGGQLLTNRELSAQPVEDIKHGETISLPITLVVLVVVFGGVVAAGIPILGALASIAGGIGGLWLFSFAMDLDPTVPAVTTVMGLALSIDYGLLVVSRYREERGRGLDAGAAVEATVATAGRTVSFSAMVVIVSLSGLFVFDVTIFRALGAAGVSVTLIAALSALTLVPALLAVAHRRIRAPQHELPVEGGFSRLARAVQRRPLLVAGSVAALLVVGGLPFLRVEFANEGPEQLPRSFESREFADLLRARFPVEATAPVQLVADADSGTVDSWAAGLADEPHVAAVRPAQPLAEGVTLLEVVPTGTTQGQDARALVERLRDGDPGFPVLVTGEAALLVDFLAEIRTGMPGALAVLVGGAFVLLFLMTGSVLVPLKALVMNVLSLGAAFGVLVWGFQEGGLSGLLGFDATGALPPWLPVIIFAFAFGMSMDYEVFLLSRVKEAYDAGHRTDEAVALGLQRSGRIITSAALIMIIVFAGFATGQMLAIKELGVAMVVAIAVDATLVRLLLVPATMTLLDEWNWWAPGPLRRLHARLGLREHGDPVPAGPPVVEQVPARR